MNKEKIKQVLRNKKVIKVITAIGIVVIVAIPIGITARKINQQNYIIEQLNQDKEYLGTHIEELDNDIEKLNTEINERIKIEDGLNKTIKDLNDINLNLQQDKLDLQKKNDEINEELTHKKTRVDYLEQRTSELKEELKKNNKPKQPNGIKVAVDIGHNMTPDSGSVSKYGKEDTFTKEVGESLITQLQNEGYEVVRVNPAKVSSVNDSLKQRINKANKEEVDLFLSIHFNAFSDKNSQGTEVFVYESDEKLNKMGKSIIDNFEKYGFKDRGVKTANFSVLRNAEVPAMLIECGFITNPEDMGRYEADKMAENILNGVKEVF